MTYVQVSSATATFAMTFSSSMSVVEYYLLKRFPVPYGNHGHLTPITFSRLFCSVIFNHHSITHLNICGLFSLLAALYFVAVATIAAFVGQHVVRKLIILLGRASLIIFILAFMIFVSAISLG